MLWSANLRAVVPKRTILGLTGGGFVFVIMGPIQARQLLLKNGARSSPAHFFAKFVHHFGSIGGGLCQHFMPFLGRPGGGRALSG